MLESYREFYSIIKDLLKEPMVQDLKKYRQHYQTNCYKHCIKVAYLGFLICKKHNWDYISYARAAMLHDLFLYDWRKKQPDRKGLHAFRHPRIALNNALKIVKLNSKEQDIILKHMWPLTVFLPKYKESYLITMVDKHCTLAESVKYYTRKIRKK